MAIFKGWVPNVSGCLSFSNIKGCEIPGRADVPCTYNNLADDSANSIYSLQRRNLSDTLYAPLDLGGVFYYLLSATVNDEGILVGSIYAFPQSSLACTDKSLIKTFVAPTPPGITNTKDAATKLIAQRELHQATICVGFKLQRDGFAEFSYTGESEHAYPFTLEAYSFLKDLVHAHKFHRYDDDAIVVPYPVDNDNDIKWIEKTIRNLHKSIVVTYRNTNYQADLINALGRLSYLEAFQYIISLRNITLPHSVHTPTLRSSLETKLNSADFKENGKAILLQIIAPLFLALLGLLITMTQLLQIPCIEGLSVDPQTCIYDGKPNVFKLSGNSISVARFLLEHLYELAVILPAFAIVFIFLAHLQAILRWLNQRIGYGIVGWFQKLTFGIAVSYGRTIASIWLLILMATLLFLTYIASRHLLLL